MLIIQRNTRRAGFYIRHLQAILQLQHQGVHVPDHLHHNFGNTLNMSICIRDFKGKEVVFHIVCRKPLIVEGILILPSRMVRTTVIYLCLCR